MSTSPSRVYAARLVGLPIFDPQGDQVGKVRDLVVAVRSEISQPRVLGLVAEVFGRRRIFVPMTRVTNIDSGQVYTTGLLNMRRFEQRSTETLVIGQMLDRTVTIPSAGVTGTVYDVAMEQARNRDWVLSRVAIQEPTKGLRRRPNTSATMPRTRGWLVSVRSATTRSRTLATWSPWGSKIGSPTRRATKTRDGVVLTWVHVSLCLHDLR